VILTAAWLMMMLDVVIDPVTLQGSKWFLGDIYYYPNGGQHFGVPISNYVGWFFVAVTALLVFTTIEKFAMPPATGKEMGIRWLPYSGLLGPLVFAGVIVFNLVITFVIGDITLFWSGVFIWGTPLLLYLIRIASPAACASRAQIAAAIDSYPDSPVVKRLFPNGPYSDLECSKESR
jgi:putative membrane protein